MRLLGLKRIVANHAKPNYAKSGFDKSGYDKSDFDKTAETESGSELSSMERVLIVIASCLIVFMLYLFLKLNQQIVDAKNHLSLQTLERTEYSPDATKSGLLSAETKVINVAVDEINAPWDNLFRELEANNNLDIKVLTFEPNLKQKHIRMVLEASNTTQMTQYISSLSNLKSLTHVVLLNHERVPEVNAIRFTLEGKWQIQ